MFAGHPHAERYGDLRRRAATVVSQRLSDLATIMLLGAVPPLTGDDEVDEKIQRMYLMSLLD